MTARFLGLINLESLIRISKMTRLSPEPVPWRDSPCDLRTHRLARILAHRALGQRGRAGEPLDRRMRHSQAPTAPPDAVLARSLEGNQRFVKGQLLHLGGGRRTSPRWPRARRRSPSSSPVQTPGWLPSWSSTRGSATCSSSAWRATPSAARARRQGEHRVRRRRTGRQADHGARPQSVWCGQGRDRAHRRQRRPARGRFATSFDLIRPAAAQVKANPATS